MHKCGSSHFPQLVTTFACLIRFIFVVTKMSNPKVMKEYASLHCISIRSPKELY